MNVQYIFNRTFGVLQSWSGHYGEEKHLLSFQDSSDIYIHMWGNKVHKFTVLTALTVVSNERMVSKK